ncbi:MFS transporter [Kitasatospora arboriphila]
MLAGVLYGLVAWRRSARSRMLGCYALLVLGCSTLWAMPNLTALSVAGLLCGLAIAPTLITGYTLVETLVSDGAKTEAFTWLTGAIGLGLAVGSTVAGRLIDSGGPSAASSCRSSARASAWSRWSPCGGCWSLRGTPPRPLRSAPRPGRRPRTTVSGRACGPGRHGLPGRRRHRAAAARGCGNRALRPRARRPGPISHPASLDCSSGIPHH